MKKMFVVLVLVFVLSSSYGLTCQADEPVGVSNVNTFTPTNTFNPTNNFTPTVIGGDNSGNTNTFSGITGGSLNPLSSGTQSQSTKTSLSAPAPGSTGVQGVGVAGIGQANNSGSGQMNNGIGNQLNNAGTYVENSGQGAGSTTVNQKYEEARQMAMVISGAVTSTLRFKEGAHSNITDSRVMLVDEILDYLNVLEYEECKRGRGDVKVIDGLVRSQFEKTNTIAFHKSKSEIDTSKFRFMGFLTGIAASNDATMENVVYGVGEKAMEHGATDVVKVKESATEWGDTTGYAFDVGGFVTSIIGGAGSRAIGPGGSVGAGYNGMKGGSADRSDVKFAVFVSNDRLIEVSQKHAAKTK